MNGVYYTLKTNGGSSSFTRIMPLNDIQELYIFAEGSLEGWGSISVEFTELFLEYLTRYTMHLEDNVFANDAQNAFCQALAVSQTSYPFWSYVQYVVAFITKTTLRFSWIGDMYLIVWQAEKVWMVNRPHVIKGQGVHGETQTAILKSLRFKNAIPEEIVPEVGIPFDLTFPTILFLGNQNPATLLPESELFRELITDPSNMVFQRCCEKIDIALECRSIRGIFVYFQ